MSLHKSLSRITAKNNLINIDQNKNSNQMMEQKKNLHGIENTSSHSALAFIHNPIIKQRYKLNNSDLVRHHISNGKSTHQDINMHPYSLSITLSERASSRLTLASSTYGPKRKTPPMVETRIDTYSDIIHRSKARQKKLKMKYMKDRNEVRIIILHQTFFYILHIVYIMNHNHNTDSK